MQTALTKPQASFLFRAMRETKLCPRGRGEKRTTNVLYERGLLTLVRDDGIFQPEYEVSLAGMKALLAYWQAKDAASGCIAYQTRRQEVEAALDARFPEPQPIAA